MATRGMIVFTNEDFGRYANAKNTTKLLKCISESDSSKWIFNMFDSDKLLDKLMKLIEKDSFKYYWQYGDTVDIMNISFVLLTNLLSEDNEKNGFNLDLYLHRNFITDNYYVDSEYIYWFDWFNKELKKYECSWTDLESINDWDIESLKLVECVDIPVEKIDLLNRCC